MRISEYGTGEAAPNHDVVVISDVHLHEGTSGSVVQALVRLFTRLAEDNGTESPLETFCPESFEKEKEAGPEPFSKDGTGKGIPGEKAFTGQGSFSVRVESGEEDQPSNLVSGPACGASQPQRMNGSRFSLGQALQEGCSLVPLQPPRFLAVFAGDFFDFPLVTSVPSPGEAGFQVSERERRFGLEASGEKTAWKIQCLARRHPELFAAMARFVRNGNEMVFIPGNHDEELLLPEVQTCLQRLLGGGAKAGNHDKEKVHHASVRFTPWFYHEPGFIFVEHGHFYDNDNVPLAPLRPCPLPANTRIDHPLGSLVTRYLLTLLRGYDFQGDSDRTPWPLLVKVIRSYGVRAPLTIYRYYAMAARVLRMTGAKMRSGWARGGISLEESAKSLRVRSRQLKQLLRFTAEPTTDSFRKTVGRLYLDRSAAFAFFLGTIVFLAFQLLRGSTSGLWLPFVALGTLLFTLRSGNLFGHKTGPMCREAAKRIQQVLDTPFVVMGHAHQAEKLQMTALDGRSWTYVNTGSFGEPCNGKGNEYPYLVVRRGSGYADLLTTGAMDFLKHTSP